MRKKRKILLMLVFSAIALTFTAPAAQANGNEYKAIVNHLKVKYRAKKVKIPFMWLARMAVGIVRPAGVKSFSVTLFQDLQFSSETLDQEMQMAMRNSFSQEWDPIFHIRSREGQQVYMYMRQAENSEDLKVALVTIDKTQAAVIRATFSPDKLAEFINNPKVMGITLNDDDRDDAEKSGVSNSTENIQSKEN